MSGKLINHYNAGDQVKVTKVVSGWCKVDLKNYQNAYVFCKNLEMMGPPPFKYIVPNSNEILPNQELTLTKFFIKDNSNIS